MPNLVEHPLPTLLDAGLPVDYVQNVTDVDDPLFERAARDGVDWRDGVQVFAHGERESIKEVRRVLKQRGVPREAISISGYWARGRTEDAFQAEKRTPVGQID